MSVTDHAGYLTPWTAEELFAWMHGRAPWQRAAPLIFGKANFTVPHAR